MTANGHPSQPALTPVVHRLRARMSVAFAALLLTGCTLLPAAEPLAIYRLPQLAESVPRLPGNSNGTLRVDTPQASPAVASLRILVLPDGHQLSAYRGARWSDPPTVQWREKLAAALRDQGYFRVVSTDDYSHRSELALDGDLLAFEVEYVEGEPRVHVAYTAYLTHTANRTVLATRRFTHQQPLPGAQLVDVIQGFGQASDTLALQVAAWVAQVAAEAPAAGAVSAPGQG